MLRVFFSQKSLFGATIYECRINSENVLKPFPFKGPHMAFSGYFARLSKELKFGLDM